jgi:predicted nucleotidyltransferase
MDRKIESVINTFLEPYFTDNDIQGAILTGSYAQGNQNKYSDIDIFIISSDKLDWRERGSKIISDYVLEYFINPPKKVIQEIEEYKHIATSAIIINGIELFDKTGIIKILKEKAFKAVYIPMTPMNMGEIEMMKYYIHYYYEQIKRAYEDNSDEFPFLYYTFLEYIIYSYGRNVGISLPPKTKIYQYVFDEEYYLIKELKKIDDMEILKLLKECMKNNKNEIMYENITELKDYFLNSIGGFNIDGWKIRSEVK